MRAAHRAFCLAWFAARLGTLALNAATIPRLAPAGATPAATVSILVPARNEAHNLPLSLPGLLAQGAHEVLVLDDQSTDATGEVAAGLGARLLPGRPLPEGWHGKQWANHQLAEAATGDLLLFVDADVRFSPGAVAALVAARERQGARLCSVLPQARELGPGARLLTPLVEALVLCHAPHPVLGSRLTAAAWAAGMAIMIDRGTYERVGGWAGVRDAVLDDVALAQAVKRGGDRVGQALGMDLVGVRMYRSYAESVAGFGKNVRAVHLDSRAVLTASVLTNLAAYSLPWLLRPRGSVDRLVRVLSLLERTLVPVVAGHPRDAWEGLLSPVTPVLGLPGYVLGMRRRRTWKGRVLRR